MFGAIGRAAWSLRLIAFAFLVLTAVTIRSEIKEGIKQRQLDAIMTMDLSVRPVQVVLLDHRECRGDHFIVSGLLDKTRYPTNPLHFEPTKNEATWQGMEVYTIEGTVRRLPWRRTSESDRSAASRRYGRQTLDFIIEGPCDVVFTLDTVHTSPMTGRTIRMRWGPFSP